MERVLGIGGHFMRADDPAALTAWYRDCLGLPADEHGEEGSQRKHNRGLEPAFEQAAAALVQAADDEDRT